MKYTKDVLEPLVKDSLSIAEVCKKLNKPSHGYFHTHISGCIKKFNIDISHFLGQRANSGKYHKGGYKKTVWQDYLVNGKFSFRSTARKLRKCLLEFGREYKCEKCGNNGMWLNKRLTLQVDHINNNPIDNRPENLMFLCPNCHAQKTNGDVTE